MTIKSDNLYRLSWFDILSYRKNKVVIYGVGQWWMHIADWKGCNYYHARLANSPLFKTTDDALDWLRKSVVDDVYEKNMKLKGHHSGKGMCPQGCDDRRVNQAPVSFGDLRRDNTFDERKEQIRKDAEKFFGE